MWRNPGLNTTGWVSQAMVAAFLFSPSLALAEEEIPTDLLMGVEGNGASAADAGEMWWTGFQLFLVKDQLPQEQPTGYGLGMGMAIPIHINLYRGLGTRMRLGLTYSGSPPMNDALTEISYVIPAEEVGDSDLMVTSPQDGYFAAAEFDLGVAYTISLLEGTVNPYVAAGPSFLLIYVFPDLPEEEDFLLPDGADTLRGVSSVDPYTVDVTLGANAAGGVHFRLSDSLYLSTEVNYTIAAVSESRL